jgi:hypothetical protein
MRVVWTSQLLWASETYLSYVKPILADTQKEIGSIECILHFGTPVLLEYQKELFMDTLSDLVWWAQMEWMTFEKIQQLFELALQDVNVRLAAFGEKMQEKGPFIIDGVLQIFWNNQYIASLIWNTSVVVLRKNKVHYRVCQDRPDTNPRIDRFNELLEGDLKDDDQLLVVWTWLDTYLDKEDMNGVIEHAEVQERSLQDTLLTLLTTRVEKETVWFVWLRTSEATPLLAESRVWRNVLRLMDRFVPNMSVLKKFQHLAVYWLLWLITLIMLTWIIESFLSSTNQSFSTVTNGQVTAITLEDIQKDLATFKRIDPSSEQKIKKYNDIVAQLDLLDKNKKWTLDSKKLRAILEKDYLEGFNIESILDLDQATALLYTFSQQEKNTVGEFKQVLWNNGVYAVWNQWMVINGVDDQVRGTIVSAWVQRKVNACSLNLFKNWLYCAMDDGKLFNVMKSGLQPVWTEDTDGFGINIWAVSTFGKNFMYTMKNPTSLSTGTSTFSLLKYTNQRGNQEAFWPATRYDIQSDPEFAKITSGITHVTIDGTFLIWSPVNASLRQLRRPWVDNKLLVRQVPLQWGDTLRAPWKQSKVFAFADARFVYIWDPETQIFTVYRSSPFKNNDAHTTDYTLPYFFSVKFSAWETKVLDVFVEEWETASLYIMTANEVRKLSLSDLRERFFKQEADKEKE